MVNTHYELLYIIPLRYTDDENIKITQEVEELIKKYKGTILKTSILGKRKLAYEIKHIHNGYYVATHFNMEDGRGLMGLTKELNLKINDNILRFQIVKTTLNLDEEKYKIMFGKKTQDEQETVVTTKKEVKVEVEKKKKTVKKEINEEELNKKIEEIMDDDAKDLKNK